jgi:nicotinamide-nucleotide amidase
VEPAASNKRQAYIPEGFQIVKNEVGSAPGFIGSSGGCRIVALPGPPHELRHVVESQLVPLLEAEYELTEEEELRGTAFLVGESSLEDAVQWAAADSGVRWGTRAEPLGVDFYIRGGSKQDRDHVFDRIVERLDGFRIRRGSAGAAEHLSAALKEYRRALVTAESCTGGMILSLLTDIPGSSEIVWGGFVTYSNDAKRSVLGVAEDTLRTHGAVSVETVTAMVEGALNAGGADVAIAVSGIAGPSGGTPEKPVGTVYIGVGLRSGTPKIAGFRFVGGRDRVRRKSSVVAMLMAADVVRGSDVDLDTYDIC